MSAAVQRATTMRVASGTGLGAVLSLRGLARVQRRCFTQTFGGRNGMVLAKHGPAEVVVVP